MRIIRKYWCREKASPKRKGMTEIGFQKELVLRISELFPAYPVYTEEMEQGFSPPCFYVKQVCAERKSELFGRVLCRETFEIQFWAEEGNRRESEKTASLLTSKLGRADHILPGSHEITSQIKEQVTHIGITYYSREQEEGGQIPYMKTLQSRQRIGNNSE